MGTYYRIVNHATKERIEPDCIGSGGLKERAMIGGAAGRLFMFLHIWGDSHKWEMLHDCGDEYYQSAAYKNVTSDKAKEFNEFYPEMWIDLHADSSGVNWEKSQNPRPDDWEQKYGAHGVRREMF